VPVAVSAPDVATVMSDIQLLGGHRHRGGPRRSPTG
jgi:hypothetical protein